MSVGMYLWKNCFDGKLQLVLIQKSTGNKQIFFIVINLTTYTFIATARGGTALSTAFSFVCWLYNNNMVAGGSRCSAI